VDKIAPPDCYETLNLPSSVTQLAKKRQILQVLTLQNYLKLFANASTSTNANCMLQEATNRVKNLQNLAFFASKAS